MNCVPRQMSIINQSFKWIQKTTPLNNSNQFPSKTQIFMLIRIKSQHCNKNETIDTKKTLQTLIEM